MDRMEAKLKHLEMLQAIISRMAHNSFLLKGWAVTLVAALFALAAKDANPWFIWLALYPVSVFWALDAWFLRQERLFRCLYDKVREKAPNQINFDMNPARHQCTSDHLASVMWSVTLRTFYLGLLVGIVVVGLFLDR